MVHRQFRDMDRKSFLIIYKGFIRPHLEYAIQTWSPYQKGDIEHLEKHGAIAAVNTAAFTVEK